MHIFGFVGGKETIFQERHNLHLERRTTFKVEYTVMRSNLVKHSQIESGHESMQLLAS